MFDSILKALVALAALFLCLTQNSAPAQPVPANSERIISANEVVRMALTNNLDILISQVAPQVDQFALNSLYGGFEPNLTMSAVHSYDSIPGGVFTQDGTIYGSTLEKINSYNAGLSGVLPTGLQYNFTGPIARDDISQFGGHLVDYTSGPGVTLTQPLLKNFWINSPLYQIQLSKKTLRMDQLGLRLQIMTVINNVKAAYYNLIFSRQNVQVEEAAVQLAEETWHEDEQRVKVGALAPLDEKQAESQAASARSDLLTAQTSLALQENVLKGLMALHLDQWTSVTPVPSEPLLAVPENPDLQECWRQGVEKRPDLLQAKVALEKQHVAVKYNFNQLFPELDAIGGYGHNATTLTFGDNLSTIRDGNFPYFSYGLSLSFPLGNTTARNNYKSAKAAVAQLVLQMKKIESVIILAVDNDVKTVRSGFLKVNSTRQARIYAEDALQAEQTKLEHGKSTSFFVLQLQNNLTAARSAEIRALADYNIALEQLAFDDGTTLERNRIQLEIR